MIFMITPNFVFVTAFVFLKNLRQFIGDCLNNPIDNKRKEYNIMSSIDKVKVGDTTYDVSPSKDGTLNGYTSNDEGTPAEWGEVNVISTSDTNSSIFSKLTGMVRNVRWLYAKLGTEDFSGTGQSTITGALSSLQSGLDGKSPLSHTHTTATLPVSSNQVNSESYVPTSALLYSMVQRANTVADNVATANEIINGGGGDPSDPSDPSVDATDPNTRYESKDLGIWSSTSDVDEFMSKYNHANNYTGLSLGNYVTIQDGAYNAQWVIAGFDKEYNQIAADGTTYNNGYGICMIPKTYVSGGNWNTEADNTDGYKSSYMHNTILPRIITKLKTVLGTHVVNRNVLLSSAVMYNSSTAYTWTTADATLMSVGQCTGTFASNNNQYDDGEANYKLPLFNYENYNTGSQFWTRGIDGNSAWTVNRGGIRGLNTNHQAAVRPLIYLR